MNDGTYQIAVSWHEEVLQIVISGEVTAVTADELAQKVPQLIRAHKPGRVLIDCLAVQGRLSVIETFFHVRKYPPRNHFNPRVAVLDRAENESYYSFHEIAAANVGFQIKYFNC